MAATKRQLKTRFPIVRVMCVLSGCMATLIGVVMNLSPDVILFRVLLSVAMTAVVVSVSQSINQVMQAHS